MSTKKTTNYNLHSWEPDDDFLRSEFNENFDKLDAELKKGLDGLASAAKSDNSALKKELSDSIAQLTGTVTSNKGEAEAALAQLRESKSRVVSGYYSGLYQGSNTSNLAQQKISLGFQPQLVIVFSNDSRVQFMAIPGHSAYYYSDLLIVTEDGFTAGSNMKTTGANDSALSYYYMAVQ